MLSFWTLFSITSVGESCNQISLTTIILLTILSNCHGQMQDFIKGGMGAATIAAGVTILCSQLLPSSPREKQLEIFKSFSQVRISTSLSCAATHPLLSPFNCCHCSQLTWEQWGKGGGENGTDGLQRYYCHAPAFESELSKCLNAGSCSGRRTDMSSLPSHLASTLCHCIK